MAQVRASRSAPITSSHDASSNDSCALGLRFSSLFLGPLLKYSASIFPSDGASLAEAELFSLEEYIKKAEIRDGHYILDIGYVLLCSQAAV
jgi:cyclopropane fatty-acyl-phospholipid synthase-like methyltransferase